MLVVVDRRPAVAIRSPRAVKVTTGRRGPQGLSAYQVAVANGFEGTEAEWLESLGGSGSGGGGEKSVHMVGAAVPLTFSIIAAALSARTITVVHGLRTAAGTCTVTIAINGTPVTGLSNLAASSTPSDHTATGGNAVAEGDEVTVAIADVSGATDLKFTIGME